jgi:multiple sugar transport system ATP-binding protein
MARVELSGVTKVFAGNVRAVCELSLDIADGEFLVLVGPSGCGKSTVLRMVAGLEQPTSGTISIGGRVVNQVAPKDRDIAMVFQNYALYPHKTVRGNLAFALKLRRLPRKEIDARIERTAELLDLTELLERRPKALSGGQRQRVALGRAIVREPAAFLFDEPLSNLDAKLRAQMRTEIHRLHQQLNTTMIYVTHDQVEAMTMGDRIVLLRAGVVQQLAEPITLYERPANRFVAGFIGTPQMNFVDGVLMHHAEQLVFDADGQLSVPVPSPQRAALASFAGRRVTLGVRPEDLGSPRAEAQPSPPRLEAIVELVEPMGAESYVHLRAGRETYIRRADPRSGLQPGQATRPALDVERLHFFDAESGAALTAT